MQEAPSSPSAPVRLFSPGVLRRLTFRLTTLMALALFGVVWTASYLYLQLDREKTIEAAVANTTNMARVFQSHVARSIKDIDQTILFLRQSYQSDPAGFDLPAWTSNSYLLHDLVLQISLIGKDGMLLTTNIVRNPDHVDLSDRVHFKVHATSQDDKLFISKPVLGRASGKWSIQITRRVSAPDGSFGGVLVASMDPYYLSGIFDQMDLGREGAITLLDTDGIILARAGLNNDTLGQSVASSELFKAAQGPQGVLFGPDPITGAAKIVSYRRLDGFPLIVSASMNEGEVLAAHSNRSQMVIWLAIGLSLAIALVTVSSALHDLKLMRAQAAQRDSERQAAEKSAELEATLANMSQGIIMCDAAGSLRVFNDRAVEFLHLSRSVAVGHKLPAEAAILLGKARPTISIAPVGKEIVLPDGSDAELVARRLTDGGILYTLTAIAPTRANTVERSRSMPATT